MSFLKKTLIAIGFLIILSVIGTSLLWHIAVEHLATRFTSRYIVNIASPVVSIEKIGKIHTKKQFPYINIYLDKLYLKKNKTTVRTENISDKISIFKAVAAYLMHKKYYGDIYIDKMYADIKLPKPSKKPAQIFIAPIPISVNIKNADIIFRKHIFKGSIDIGYNAILGNNSVDFKGTADSNRINLHLALKKHKILSDINAHFDKLKFYQIKHIYGSFELSNFRELTFNINVDKINYKGINIIKPYFSGSVVKKDSNNFKINSINISSENGFFLYLNGNIDTKHILNSNIAGSIATPFIDVTPFISIIPVKNIDQYVKSANIKIKNLKFSGVLSPKSIKTGTIYAKHTQFRISKNTGYFHVKHAFINISQDDVEATADGTFSTIKFQNSTLTVHRIKGYPCDMDLHYYGIADSSANKFLKNAIIPKDDWALLGNATNIKGYVDATTVVRGYRWSSKPFFDFDIVINAKDVSFNDDNIPQKFIQASGTVEIKRVMSFGKIKNMYVKLKNIDAKTKTSHLTTKLSTIYLHPLRFDGTFSTNISKYDFTFLENHLLDKQIFTPQGKMHITGKLKGNAKNFGYSAHIIAGYTIFSKSLSASAIDVNGNFNKGILNIKNISIKKDGKKILGLKGSANIKKFSYDIVLDAVNFEVPYIFTLVPQKTILLKDGVLNGEVKISGIMDKITSSSGNIILKNGYISDKINDINFTSNFNNKKLNISNGQCMLIGNKTKFNASILFSKEKSISANIKADTFNIDYKKLKSKKKDRKFRINLPKIGININGNIKQLSIRNFMGDAGLKNVHFNIFNSAKESNIKLNSDDTNIDIAVKKRKNRCDMSIHIKDSSLFAQLTKYDKKDNKFIFNSMLHNNNANIIDIKNLYGTAQLEIRNGSFKGMPHMYKILSATNITQILIGKIKFKKDFRYKEISGTFDIKNGIITTPSGKALIARGEDIDIFTTGKYELLKNYIDIHTIFTTFRGINKIISSIPLIGWIIGGKEKSFTGVAFHIKGDIDGKLSVKPIPLKNMGEGIIDIIKRTITLPIHIFGVK